MKMSAHTERLAELKSKGDLTETEKDEVRLIESYLATLEPAPEAPAEEPTVSTAKVKKGKGKK